MNRITKSISVLVMVCILAAFTVFVNAADDISITADKTTLDTGETLTITVELPGGSLYNGGEIVVTYPAEKLTYAGTETAELFKNAFLNDLKEKSGKVTLTAIYASDFADGGVFGKFSFKPATESAADAVINVNVKASNSQFKNTVVEESFGIIINGGETVPEANTRAATVPPSSGSSSSNGSSGRRSVSATEVPSEAVPTPVPEASGIPAAASVSNETKPSELTFTDIGDHWARAEITQLYNNGLVDGFADHTFHPDDNVTRAQFVKMLIDAKGIKADSARKIFNDVSEDAWYAAHAAAAYDAGIAEGDDEGYFNPDANITRQEMAVMATRAFDLKSGGQCGFADVSAIARWAVDSVTAAAEAGVINGMDDNKFSPLENTTRAQAAVIIYRLLGLK